MLYESVEKYNHYFTVGGLILLLLCLLYILWNALKRRDTSDARAKNQ